jgi:hypothetical protein
MLVESFESVVDAIASCMALALFFCRSARTFDRQGIPPTLPFNETTYMPVADYLFGSIPNMRKSCV